MSENLITSPTNEFIKSIRKLKDRKYRDLSKTAYVEGSRLVIEAIHQNAQIQKILISETFMNAPKRQDTIKLLTNYSDRIVTVTDEVFSTFSLKDSPQGIGAVVQQRWRLPSEYKNSLTGVWICLWEVADPGNLGTILRTMDAVSASGLILSGNCTDPYDPASVRASMGAIFTKILVKSTLEETIALIQENPIRVIGTSDSARMNYRNVNYPQDLLLIMGSERQGLPNALQELCTESVRIPMLGTCDSLNLAVATGVLLYEILAQHK